MLPTRTPALAATLGALALGALALAGPADEWIPTSGPEPARAAAKAAKLTVKASPYGPVVFANGYAMYVFDRDQGSRSRCYGKCAEAWPPLRARADVVAGRGIDSRLIGTTKRRNGSRQITYAGRPLYGYVHDPRGEVFCHDVREFGGLWLAVQRSGEPAPR